MSRQRSQEVTADFQNRVLLAPTLNQMKKRRVSITLGNPGKIEYCINQITNATLTYKKSWFIKAARNFLKIKGRELV